MLLAAMASVACGKNQAARVDGASAGGGVAGAGGGGGGASGGSASGGRGGSAGSGAGGSASGGSGGSSGGGSGGRSAGGSGGRADGSDSPLAQQGGGASGQGGDAGAGLGFSRCIEDWPTAGGPHPIKPSLSVEAGRVLWRKQFNGSTSGDLSDGGPVLSSDRLAFAAGAYVYFVNKDGSGEQRVRHHASGFYPSDLVADLDGNVYYATPDGLFSVNANGQLRWSLTISLPANVGEFASGFPPVLGPDGVVYFATLDQTVGAYRTSDGKTLWSKPGPGSQSISQARVMGGGGKALFVAYAGVYPDARADALDTRDGSRLGAFVRPAYGASFTWGWGSWVQGWDLGIGHGNFYVFDTCGQLRWSGSPQGSGVISVDELLVISTSATSGTLSSFDTLGRVVVGPAPAEGRTVAAGADGSIYMFRCDDAATSTNRILAYSRDLKELWRLDLGGAACKGMTGNVILDDAGVLYLMRPGDGAGTAEVIAIQTASPGLADSSWPSTRHDNRGTAWLVPGVGVSGTIDGGAVVDAPVPQGN